MSELPPSHRDAAEMVRRGDWRAALVVTVILLGLLAAVVAVGR